jgi:hypothetical protein
MERYTFGGDNPNREARSLGVNRLFKPVRFAEEARSIEFVRLLPSPPTHNQEPYDALLYCPTSCPYRSVRKEGRLHCLDDFEQSNNTAMLVPNTNTRARCTGDDESAPKTRDSTRRRLLLTYRQDPYAERCAACSSNIPCQVRAASRHATALWAPRDPGDGGGGGGPARAAREDLWR